MFSMYLWSIGRATCPLCIYRVVDKERARYVFMDWWTWKILSMYLRSDGHGLRAMCTYIIYGKSIMEHVLHVFME